MQTLESLHTSTKVQYSPGTMYLLSTAAKCLRALSGLFSPNLTNQSSCKMGLVLECVVRILYDDWSIKLQENRPDMGLKHLAVMHISYEIIHSSPGFLRIEENRDQHKICARD